MSRPEVREEEGMTFRRPYESKTDQKRRIEITQMRVARRINRARIHAAVRGRPLSAEQMKSMSAHHAAEFHRAFISLDEAYSERMAMLAAKAAWKAKGLRQVKKNTYKHRVEA